MIEMIKKLFVKYAVEVKYVIVGAITVFFSWGFKWLATLFLDSSVLWQNTILTCIQWVSGVTVAFILNRRYVFQSHNSRWQVELLQFCSGRIGTGVAGIVIMGILVNGLKMDLWIATVLWGILEVFANYFISKFWVFRTCEAKHGHG